MGLLLWWDFKITSVAAQKLILQTSLLSPSTDDIISLAANSTSFSMVRSTIKSFILLCKLLYPKMDPQQKQLFFGKFYLAQSCSKKLYIPHPITTQNMSFICRTLTLDPVKARSHQTKKLGFCPYRLLIANLSQFVMLSLRIDSAIT